MKQNPAAPRTGRTHLPLHMKGLKSMSNTSTITGKTVPAKRSTARMVLFCIVTVFMLLIIPGGIAVRRLMADSADTGGFTPASGFITTPMIVAGYERTTVLRYDGTVWAWGWNISGQLGDGTAASRITPVQVRYLSNIVNLAAGFTHTLALRYDGTVWACV